MFKHVKCLLICLILPVLAVSFWAIAENSPASPMVIRYHYTAGNDFQHEYNFELIRHILEVTRAEYGDYQLAPYSQAPNAKRQAQLLTEGKLMNVHWAPPSTDIARADVIPIPVDILYGLQGYRICLVNSEATVGFAAVQNLESLKKLRIAQGFAWDEIAIYHFNGLQPLEAPILGGLYPMLGLKRFDCLPLGINEISTLFDTHRKQYPFLAIEASLIIYYEFPIYFYVSKKHPEIAARFLLGLKKLKKTGEFDQLFKQYHEKNLATLGLLKRKIICLKSPLVNNPHQCEAPTALPAILKQFDL
jgi:hypothetical protein